MANADKKDETTQDETVDVEETETVPEAEVEKTNTEGDESDDTTKLIEKEEERDFDAEIEEERKKGKPDPLKAKEAFKDRSKKKKQVVEEADETETEDEDEEFNENDDDRPLTRREMNEMLAANKKVAQETQAYTFARKLALSDKEAELIVLKWQNRTFPQGTTLQEQIEESYAITNRKKIIGQRDEALRALRARDTAKGSAATTHRDTPEAKEPKMAAQDASAIKAAGMAFNGSTRRYEKKLPNGDLIYRDPRTHRTVHVRKSS